jgi:4-amino-4-deoxy-L-arabinose transferase-like glycosyltransferase
VTSSADTPAPPAWRAYLLVGALSGLVVFWRLGAEAMDDHECHAALTARTMVHPDRWLVPGELDGRTYAIPPNTPLNHWLVPVENGRPRLVKTPLGYWLIAAGSLTGGEVTSFTARLPSAAAGVLTALLALALGRRLLTPRAALLGALMLATSYGFQRWSRNARPEALLTLLMTAAMACFYFSLAARGARRRLAWTAGFWIALGLANLAKPFVPLLLAWPVVAFVCWRRAARRGDEPALRRLRRFLAGSLLGAVLVACISTVPQLRWWRAVGVGTEPGYYATFAVLLGGPMLWLLVRSRGWRPVGALLPTALPGLAVMLLLFVPWMAYMARLFPGLAGDVFRHQVTERTAGASGWEVNRPWLYVESLTTYAFLWLPLLPGAVAVALSRRLSRGRAGRVYLLLWAAGLVLLFTAAAGKRDHYMLPVLPPLFLLCGSFVDALLRRAPRGRTARLLGGLYAAVAVGTVAIVAALTSAVPDQRHLHVLAVTVGGAAPVALAGLLTLRGRPRVLVPLVAAAAAVVYTAHGAATELWDSRGPVRRFARTAGAVVPPNADVRHWKEPEPNVVFYFGRQLPAAQWAVADAAERHGRPEARRRLRAWMKSPDAPPWLVGYGEDAPRLARWGYRPELVTAGAERQRRIFTLFRKVPPDASASTSP